MKNKEKAKIVLIEASRVRRGLVAGVHLILAEPLILRFGPQPWIFDLCRRPFAAVKANDFSYRVGLAVDVGFVGVGRGVACDDDVAECEDFL